MMFGEVASLGGQGDRVCKKICEIAGSGIGQNFIRHGTKKISNLRQSFAWKRCPLKLDVKRTLGTQTARDQS
jgi:hypothetical protein